MNCLTRQEVKDVIEGRGAAGRPPILFDLWIGNNVFNGDEGVRSAWLAKYPQDVEDIFLNIPDLIHAPADDPNYRWAGTDMDDMEDQGLDARILIDDWESEEAEKFFETFPNPEYKGLIPEKKPSGERYTIARWWYGFFERHWSLRGMENALMDFYLYPDEIHHLYQKLADFYMRIMERACTEMKIDGFFISDDLGTQKSPFFSQDIFREFFKPYYKQIIVKAHELGAHFWLHTCGNIELFLPEFIEIGLDVIHPIQKYTMEEKQIAEKYGDQICILAGFDVQQTIPFGTPEEVRKEVRYLLDAYQRDDGRLMLTMGNGSTEDWKLESLQALYEEAIFYGSRNR
ncbi:MAG: uroporphyrinogen decarboxylase family protein [Lachnospiraceae bacterium]|nr:uroporphyrinogen decarboxylase family protein [Lachnospiraceae bacterium]